MSRYVFYSTLGSDVIPRYYRVIDDGQEHIVYATHVLESRSVPSELAHLNLIYLGMYNGEAIREECDRIVDYETQMNKTGFCVMFWNFFQPKPSLEITRIRISDLCLMTNPCKHHCEITYADGGKILACLSTHVLKSYPYCDHVPQRWKQHFHIN